MQVNHVIPSGVMLLPEHHHSDLAPFPRVQSFERGRAGGTRLRKHPNQWQAAVARLARESKHAVMTSSPDAERQTRC